MLPHQGNCAQTPGSFAGNDFDGPAAHSGPTLSQLAAPVGSAKVVPTGATTGGLDEIRFIAPVPAGTRTTD
jgi:acyl dehydratase